MANIKISALTTYTGSAADIRWFVMNNSGNTETTKFSGYTSPLRPATGSNSAVSANLDPSKSSGNNTLVGGQGITNSNDAASIVWGADNTCVNGGETGKAMFGRNNTSNGGGSNLTAGAGNTNNAYYSFCGGEGSSNIANNCVVWGIGNSNEQQRSVVIGSSHRNTAGYSAILGGYDNDILSTGDDYNSILGGSTNRINSGSEQSAMVACYNSNVSGSSDYVVMLGTSARTVTTSFTTNVENLHAFRTYSTAVQAVSSGTTFTCNLNNGGKAQFYLTGVTTIDITNVRDGQSFLIKTQTDGGHTITWTSTGYTFLWKGASSNPGNNKIDLFRFEVFGSIIYGELISDFS